MNYLYTIYILLFSVSFSFAQNSTHPVSLIKLPNADLSNSLEIEDSIVGPYNVSAGYGQKKELVSSSKCPVCDEDNSAWYKFSIDSNATFTFDIIPVDSMDNYDFVLFKYSENNSDVSYTRVREGWSYPCCSKAGITGLSIRKSQNKNGGHQQAYDAAMPVRKGEIYYLVITYGNNNLKSGGNPDGFMIHLHNYYHTKIPIVLNNIFFETGKAILQKESFPELDKLAGALLSSQAVIEIRGHTDNVGNEKENQKLSEERAKAVVDYLISKKVDNKRLHYKGFGSTRPVAPNTTEEGRQKNRRVEFVKMMY